MKPYSIVIRNLSKSFNGLLVLDGLDLELESGNSYCLMGASGTGKTTFLRILLGLEEPDGGTVTTEGCPEEERCMTAVFQEDRLCETFSALDNVLLAAGKNINRETAYRELCRLLPEESVTRPVSTLSGGMKRRVAILRALLAPSRAIMMDEPFTGLDEDTKQVVIDYIKEKTKDKLLVVVTHQEDDVTALGGRLITLSQSTGQLHLPGTGGY